MRAWHKLGTILLLSAACRDATEPHAMPMPAQDAGPAASSVISGNGAPMSPVAPRLDASATAAPGDAARATPDAETTKADDGGNMQPSPRSDARVAEPACDDCCPDGFPRGAAAIGARKLLAFTPSPEGVTVCPDGDMFLAGDDGQIWRLPIDATAPEPWVTLSEREPAGIACDEQSRLFVAIYAVRSGDGTPGVMRIDGKDEPPVTLPGPSEIPTLSAFNGIIAIRGLGVYASDSAAGWVIRLHETSAGTFVSEIVARDILIANGLAYDSTARKLYVASSLGMVVLSFDVAADGSLSGQQQVPTTLSTFFDGVAVDQDGTVYAADYTAGAVVRLRDSMVMAAIASPASFAFRGGTLFVTDYKLNQPDLEGGLYAIDLGVCNGQR